MIQSIEERIASIEKRLLMVETHLKRIEGRLSKTEEPEEYREYAREHPSVRAEVSV